MKHPYSTYAFAAVTALAVHAKEENPSLRAITTTATTTTAHNNASRRRAATTTPSLSHSYQWTDYLVSNGQITCATADTSGSDPSSGALVTGMGCAGAYCDDVRLHCRTGGLVSDDDDVSTVSYWSAEISEETDAVVCNDDYFVTGVSCSGHYCDNLAVQCTYSEGRTSDRSEGACRWTEWLSEEGSGTLSFSDSAMFVRGMDCRGGYCDDKRFWICPVVESSVETPPPSPETCKTPKFVGNWEPSTDYPVFVAESQGAAIGDDLVVVSGFVDGYGQSTNKVYALRTSTGAEDAASWREMDDIPIDVGVTHGAFVVIGTKFYMCGGYLGGHPGPHIADCLIYDHSVAPGAGNQWSFFTPLPEGRAGGGMVYDVGTNSLIYSAGAERPEANNPDAFDQQHTWAITLSNLNGDWSARADIPYLTNHQSYASGIDAAGKQRHFFLGGQMGENEHTGNHEENYEYDVATDSWIVREPMPFTRGHASSSTRAVGCGFLIAAGSTNEFGQTADVSFYDIPTDTWTSIGSLPNALNTPVCDFGTDGYFYCESGWANGNFSYKRQVVLE